MPEIVTLVDENDNPVGTKDRALLGEDDRWRIVTVWVLNSNNELLIAKRSMNKKTNPGKWGPSVAGTVEDGDSYRETALREVQEEIGVTLSLIDGALIMHDEDLGSRANKNFIAHTELPIEAFTIQAEEVDAIAWISIPELLREIKEIPEKYLLGMESIIGVIENE